MRDLVLKIYVKFLGLRDAMKDEHGQDMVEYAIVMGLIALGATAAMNTLASTIATAFTSVTGRVSTYTT